MNKAGGLTPSDMLAAVIARRDWLTTAQIAESVGVHRVTLQRWAKCGLLPEPTAIARGRRGRSHFWPPHTLEQAVWVKARLDELWTTEEVSEALARGDFKPPSKPSS